jgi:hypothetical protein
MKRRDVVAAVFSLVWLVYPSFVSTAGAQSLWAFHDVNGQYLFGYTGVEDSGDFEHEVALNHIKTNVTTISSEWTTDLAGAIAMHNSYGVRVAIFLDTVLFQQDTPAWYLRPDYRFVFDSWFARNRVNLTPDRVAFLIIHSEANNARLSPAAVDQATAYVKSKIATIPTVVGFGFGDGSVDISAQPLPVLPDGFAFWRYATLNPADPSTLFQYWFRYFKSHMDTSRQRLIFVFDAHYGPWHINAHILQDDVGDMAIRYANLARSEPLVVGMVGFTWNSFDDVLGLRDMTTGSRIRNQTASCIMLTCP